MVWNTVLVATPVTARSTLSRSTVVKRTGPGEEAVRMNMSGPSFMLSSIWKAKRNIKWKTTSTNEEKSKRKVNIQKSRHWLALAFGGRQKAIGALWGNEAVLCQGTVN